MKILNIFVKIISPWFISIPANAFLRHAAREGKRKQVHPKQLAFAKDFGAMLLTLLITAVLFVVLAAIFG